MVLFSRDTEFQDPGQPWRSKGSSGWSGPEWLRQKSGNKMLGMVHDDGQRGQRLARAAQAIGDGAGGTQQSL